jgi:hypothetical protein
MRRRVRWVWAADAAVNLETGLAALKAQAEKGD